MNSKFKIGGVDYFFVVQNKKAAKVLHKKLNKQLPGSVAFAMDYDDGHVTYTIKHDLVELTAIEMVEDMAATRATNEALCELLARDGWNAHYDGMEYYVNTKADDFMREMQRATGERVHTFSH